MPSYLKDALTSPSIALPTTASGSVTTADIDLGSNQGSPGSDYPGTVEVLITVPALTTTMVPDTKTLTLQLQNGAAAAPTTPYLDAIVLTGAGGAGIPTQTIRRRLQTSVLRYLNLKATIGANTTDSSSLSVELALVYGDTGA